MVVRLRLQRWGRTHTPFYRMVAADHRSPRDGRFIEVVSRQHCCNCFLAISCCGCALYVIRFPSSRTILLRASVNVPNPHRLPSTGGFFSSEVTSHGLTSISCHAYPSLHLFVSLFMSLLMSPIVFLPRIHFKVGTYNPMPNKHGIKEIRLKEDRLKYWLSVGARPTDRVGWILGKFGILPPPPPRFSPQHMIPKKDREG